MRSALIIFLNFILIISWGQKHLHQVNFNKKAQAILNRIIRDVIKSPNHYKSYNLREILHYLARNYSKISEKKWNKLLDITPCFDDDKLLFPYYQKLHDLYFRNTLPLDHPLAPRGNGIETLMLAGIYPDSLNFCLFLNQENNQIYSQSEYLIRHLAHVALAINWAESFASSPLPCISNQIKKHIAESIFKHLNFATNGSDTWMEGILGILLMGEILIDNKNIFFEVKNVRCPNGRWRYDPMQNSCKETHEHPTVLAAWIMAILSKNGTVANWKWPN